MNDGRTHYADDETIAYIAKLEAELAQHRTERDKLREALGDAARSLEGIRSHAGSDPYLETMQQVRGFAESRAIAARAALTQREGGEA